MPDHLLPLTFPRFSISIARPRRCGLRNLCVKSSSPRPVHHRETCASRNGVLLPTASSPAPPPRSKLSFKRTCSACGYQRACQNTQCRFDNALTRPAATPAPKHTWGHLQPAAHGTHVVGLAITAWKWSNWWSASATTFLVAVRVENICAEHARRVVSSGPCMAHSAHDPGRTPRAYGIVLATPP
jgi:hypothetical protein